MLLLLVVAYSGQPVIICVVTVRITLHSLAVYFLFTHTHIICFPFAHSQIFYFSSYDDDLRVYFMQPGRFVFRIPEKRRPLRLHASSLSPASDQAKGDQKKGDSSAGRSRPRWGHTEIETSSVKRSIYRREEEEEAAGRRQGGNSQS